MSLISHPPDFAARLRSFTPPGGTPVSLYGVSFADMTKEELIAAIGCMEAIHRAEVERLRGRADHLLGG